MKLSRDQHHACEASANDPRLELWAFAASNVTVLVVKIGKALFRKVALPSHHGSAQITLVLLVLLLGC